MGYRIALLAASIAGAVGTVAVWLVTGPCAAARVFAGTVLLLIAFLVTMSNRRG